MHHVLFDGGSDSYETAFLIKISGLKEREMSRYYLDGLDKKKCIGFSLDYGGSKKPSATTIKGYLNDSLLPSLVSLGVSTIYCADAEYFKKLTKQTKAEPHLGYVLPCAIDSFEHINVIYGINYQSLIYNPDNQTKLDLSLQTLKDHLADSYTSIGSDIIKFEEYPESFSDILSWLKKLHQYDALACDTETFSLSFWEAGLGSIGFAWSEHEGISFAVDYQDTTRIEQATALLENRVPDACDGKYGACFDNPKIKQALKEFFTTYKGKLIWHNANYDLKVLVYELWMDDLLDYEGMIEGIEVMSRHFDDTRILTYLATNSCAGNKLSLKDQAHEFAGNYAQSDINDITLIPREELLRYNLTDCLSTWYVYNKHNPTVDTDNQREVYDTIFHPAVKQILQMELVGMPIHMPSVIKANDRLASLSRRFNNFFQAKLEEIGFKDHCRLREVDHYNSTRKKKRKTVKDFKDLTVNPGSPKQLQHLLYEYWDFPVIDKTNTKQPATGTKTLEKLKSHTDDSDKLQVLRVLIHISKVEKILAAFMPKFLSAVPVKDGTHRLYGGFNIGGTVSGRLSSSKPNLQQIPSGSTYAKLIKECFRAPPGWLFVGADYNSLEDYVSALTTRDPNKMKVYEEGYCGHCLRAWNYFKDQFPHLTDSVEDVNSIEKDYPKLRQESKAPTFALTYQGTWSTLVNNCGFSIDKAKRIEASYHEMYQVSDQWVQDRLEQACKDGYVTVAYGLRVRTPMLHQVIWNSPKMPNEAKAEGRTAGNALGQSYGLVNTKGGIDLQDRVLKSPFRTKILPCAHIHDAQYAMVKDEVAAVKFLNDNMIACMENHGLPELDWHPTVKIGAELDIFYPSWKNEITLKNNLSHKEILCQTKKYVAP